MGLVRNYNKPWRDGSVLENDEITVGGDEDEEQEGFEDEGLGGTANDTQYARQNRTDGT